MTDLKDKIKVMQHFRDGGEVEARHISGMMWGICRDPDWNFALFEYRIKPEKKKRLRTIKEIWGKTLTHEDGRAWIALGLSGGGERLRVFDEYLTVEELHELGFKVNMKGELNYENAQSLEVEE